ncbi:cdh-8 [Pristionchus pacificus]|nr:cdh-8 [Pristionchus pacificus]
MILLGLIFHLLIKGVHSISINSSLLLIEEDFPIHSDLPIKICPKSIRIIDGDPNEIFSIHSLLNSSCSTLRLNSPLDADIRTSDESSFTSFSLLLGDSSKAKVSLDIQVIDVNDNVPSLIDPPAIVTIPQGSMKGSIITTFTSFDGDSGIFGLARYSIFPKHSKVSLRNGSNDGKGRSTVELIMEDVINENIPLTLSIQDGDPTMNGTSHKTLWNFTIVPPNTPVQSYPKFSSIVYQSIIIPMDVPIGNTILSLRDDSDKEERIYAIEENMYLKVEGTSGDTILMSRTDREENKTFTIKVTDPSTGLFTQDYLHVTFKLIPISTYPFSLLPSYNFTIQEETLSNLHITELPSGVSLAISNLPQNIPLIVEGGNLRIGKIDRDMMNSDLLSFKIRAMNGTHGIIGESSIFLSIQDINDHSPIFSQANYTFGLTKEGATQKLGGIFVGRIIVSDDDATAPFNNISLYTRDPRLRVDKDGSVFTTKEIRDDEMVVRIFASDGGTPNKTSSTIVQVRMIEEERITVEKGERLIKWSGSGDSSKTYSIIRMKSPLYSNDEMKNWIEINHNNGIVRLVTEIPSTEINLFILVKGEREESLRNVILLFPYNDILSFTEREYTVYVQRPTNESIIDITLLNKVENATYTLQGFPPSLPLFIDEFGGIYWKSLNEFPLSNWMNGSILVRDEKGREDKSLINFLFNSVNLHPPQFSSASFVVFLSIPSHKGKLVSLPSPPAVDIDQDDTLHYSILNASELFSVNSSNGRVILSKDIKEEGRYQFTLVVKDNGGIIPFHEDKIEVRVIAQENNDPIGMETKLQSLSVHSNSSIGFIVTKLKYNGSMQLTSTSKQFRVNERRELIVNDKIDKLVNQKICGHLQSGAQSIPFCVNIVDKHSLPIVEFPLEGSIHLVEEGRMFYRILEIKLAKSSLPASFRLLNQTHSEWDWVSLSPSGILSTLRPLDHEKLSSIPIRIGVCSLEGRCVPLSFTINVIDMNDNCPLFEAKSMEVFIDENQSILPHKIVTIKEATDRDTTSINRNNCYSIDSPLFFFYPSSSLNIYTNTSFDREITPIINFNVSVFDCNGKCESTSGKNTSVLSIILRISNINDNFPRFSSRVKHLTLVESSSIPSGTSVAILTASDADNDVLTYSIKGSIRTNNSILDPSDAPFFVNSSTGHLLTRSILPSSSYSFTLQVNDTAHHQDQMDVHITMISIDEQTEILFEIPFHYFLENEDHITNLLSVGSSFTAVIDKCRQSGNSTIVLLHFMFSAKVADIRKAMENLNRSPSPAIIELNSVYKMRLEDMRDLHHSPINRMLFVGAAVIVFIFCLIVMVIVVRAKHDTTPPSSSNLTTSFGVHSKKRSPYWNEISAPIPTKTACQTLQSTEL